MFGHLDVYCETCCAMPGEFCVYKWVVLRDGEPMAQAAGTHIVRVKRSETEAAAKARNLLLPANIKPEEPKCPGCGGDYEAHMLNDCFESFSRPPDWT